MTIGVDAMCTACGKPSESGYTIRRDGDARGPEMLICDACSSSERVIGKLFDDLWKRAKARHDAPKFDIPDKALSSACKSCHAEIYWILTKSGKRMPIDPDGVSHFVTCPFASQHRRPR